MRHIYFGTTLRCISWLHTSIRALQRLYILLIGRHILWSLLFFEPHSGYRIRHLVHLLLPSSRPCRRRYDQNDRSTILHSEAIFSPPYAPYIYPTRWILFLYILISTKKKKKNKIRTPFFLITYSNYCYDRESYLCFLRRNFRPCFFFWGEGIGNNLIHIVFFTDYFCTNFNNTFLLVFWIRLTIVVISSSRQIVRDLRLRNI